MFYIPSQFLSQTDAPPQKPVVPRRHSKTPPLVWTKKPASPSTTLLPSQGAAYRGPIFTPPPLAAAIATRWPAGTITETALTASGVCGHAIPRHLETKTVCRLGKWCESGAEKPSVYPKSHWASSIVYVASERCRSFARLHEQQTWRTGA